MSGFLLGAAVTLLATTKEGNAIAKQAMAIGGSLAKKHLGFDMEKILSDAKVEEKEGD